MTELFEKIFDLIKVIVDRYGVKSIVAGASIYAIYSLAVQGLATIPAVVGVVVVTTGYFVFRHFETFNKSKTKE